jgi:hypothetical protein
MHCMCSSHATFHHLTTPAILDEQYRLWSTDVQYIDNSNLLNLTQKSTSQSYSVFKVVVIGVGVSFHWSEAA